MALSEYQRKLLPLYLRGNPGVKQGFALIRGGGPSGMKMVVVSTHKTREGAENAMIKRGGTPESLFTKGYSIFAFGPGTRYEYLDSEFTGKFLRPIVGNRRRGLRGNPMRSFASLHPSDRAKLNRFSDYVNSFYGKGGVYARDFKNGGFDRKTIERAIMVYIDDVRKGKAEWGDGDSIDRERVRMILQPSYSMSIPKGATILRPNRRMRRNPPMYAHGMTAHRTHGLSLKQMMKLYRLVSSGNPKAVMYARRTLGIPMSESLSQVKAVVYHHVMDLKGKM